MAGFERQRGMRRSSSPLPTAFARTTASALYTFTAAFSTQSRRPNRSATREVTLISRRNGPCSASLAGRSERPVA